MKILFLCDIYPSREKPYDGIFIKEQVDKLREQHDVLLLVIERCYRRINLSNIIKKVLFRKNSEKVKGKDYIYRIKYPTFLFLNKPLHIFNGILSYLSISRFLRKMKYTPDIIHAYKSFPAGYVGCCLKKQYICPVVITEFQGPFESYFYEPYRGKRALKAINDADKTVYSKFQTGIIEKQGIDPVKLDNICFGVDENKFNFTDENCLKRLNDIKKGRFKLIVIGRVEKAKGIDILIEAISKVRKAFPKIVLNIYGPRTNESSEILGFIKALKLDKNVFYQGIITNSMLTDIINEHDVLVSASLIETFGMTLIEAMACGKPVVATKSGGPQEIISPDVGVLVEKDDVESLAAGIQKVLANYTKYEPNKTRDYMLTFFSQEEVVGKVNTLYKKLMVK